MCRRFEVLGGSGKEIYENKLSGKRCCLCCLGLLFVVCIGAAAGACAYFLPREFSTDSHYNKLNEDDDNAFLLEDPTKCTNGANLMAQFKDKMVWKCKTSGLCVPIELRCDGYYQCQTFNNGTVLIDDTSDETECDRYCEAALKYSFNAIRFECTNNSARAVQHTYGPAKPPCFLLRYKCDGWLDCPYDEESDEDYPQCPLPSEQIHFTDGSGKRSACSTDNSFICGDRLFCIPFSYKCNGFPDCIDQSDEVGCE